MDDFVNWLLQQLAEFLRLVRGALALNPSVFRDLLASGAETPLALLVVFLAGVSEGIGTHGVALLVNRITRWRFAGGILLGGLAYLAGALLWIISIWAIARWGFGVNAPPGAVMRVVGVGYVPLLFGVLILTPLVGPPLGQLLNAWSFLIVVVALGAALELPAAAALACCAGGWLATQLLRRAAHGPAANVERWLWRMVTGRNDLIDSEDIPPRLAGYTSEPRR